MHRKQACVQQQNRQLQVLLSAAIIKATTLPDTADVYSKLLLLPPVTRQTNTKSKWSLSTQDKGHTSAVIVN